MVNTITEKDEDEDEEQPATPDLTRAVDAIREFDEVFLSWKDKDKQRLLRTLMTRYMEYERSKRHIQREGGSDVLLHSLKNNQEGLKRKVIRLDGEEHFNWTLQLGLRQIEAEEMAAEEWRKHMKQQQQEEEGKSNDQPASPVPTTTTTTTATPQPTPSQPQPQSSSSPPTQDLSKLNLRTGLRGPTPSPTPPAQEQAEPVQAVEEQDGTVRIQLEQLIMEEASKKYWTDVEKELEQGVFTRVVDLLKEVIDRLKQALPRNPERRRAMEAAVDASVDLSLVSQMIEHNAFDGPAFLQVFDALHAHIGSLQAASEDKEWNAWKQEQMQTFASNQHTWAKLLPSIFNRLLVQLDRIEAARARYEQYLQSRTPSPSPSQ